MNDEPAVLTEPRDGVLLITLIQTRVSKRFVYYEAENS